MNDSSIGKLHELTAKLAYEYWERRSHPVGSLLKFIGLRRKRLWLCPMERRKKSFPCTASV